MASVRTLLAPNPYDRFSVARLIDGKKISAQVRAEVRNDVDQWIARGHRAPYLAVVLVGENPASASYVRGKLKASAAAGIAGETLKYDADLSESALLELIARLNDDRGVDGILVQLPLPDHIHTDRVVQSLSPDKDVDGLHVVNAGRLVTGQEGFLPCTPAGIMELLRQSEIPTRGKHAVVIGRSNLVGKPLASLLMRKGADATVTVCHSRTRDLAAICRQADILVAAIGHPHFVTADMAKQGVTIVDVGINRVEDPQSKRGYRLVGDVDFDAVMDKAGWITPVPGGVGPMTIAMLLRNTLTAAQRRQAKSKRCVP